MTTTFKTKQTVIKFQNHKSDEVLNQMNNWLKENKHCKMINMTNIDTSDKWTILALVECYKQGQQQQKCHDVASSSSSHFTCSYYPGSFGEMVGITNEHRSMNN